MSMRIQLFLAGAGLALVVGLVLVSDALACRLYQPPGALIAHGGYDTVVLARVTEAGYEGEAGRDWKPWKGVATITQVMSGHTDLSTFTFGRTGSTAACDDRIPPPKPGDTWVLYLAERNGRTIVRHSFPIDVARAADPQLARQLSDLHVD